LRLSDVADVKWETLPLSGDAVINGGEGLMLIVQKLPWANTLDVTRGVEAAIDEMRPGLPGVEIDTTIFRPATFIEHAIDNLTESLLIGGLLVILVLLVFLFEWRVALISATIIPLSLMSALLVLSLRGVTINVMTLAGLAIAIGAVVDDAIVDVENTVRRLRQLRKEGSTKSTDRIILESSLEVRGAIVYASLIEISALLPVFFRRVVRPHQLALLQGGADLPLIALTVTRAGLYSLGKGADRTQPVPHHPLAAPCLRAGALADGQQAAPGVRHHWRHCCGRHRGLAVAGHRAAAVVQGAGLFDALGAQARLVSPGNVADHGSGLS
jgi:hypothetical protein